MNWCDIVSLVFSGVAVIWSILVYLMHTKKLNELETTVYKIKIENSRKADIRVNISKDEQNVKILTITNYGKATAKNVVIKGLDQHRFCIVRNPNEFVADILRPHESFEIHFTINYGACSEKITMFWDDEFQQNNMAEQHIIIPQNLQIVDLY